MTEGQSDKREGHPASSSLVEEAGSPSRGPELCRVPDGNRLPTGTPAAGVPDGPLPVEDLWKEDLNKREQSFRHHHAVCAIKCLTNGRPEKKSLVCSTGQFSWCKHFPHPQLQAPDLNKELLEEELGRNEQNQLWQVGVGFAGGWRGGGRWLQHSTAPGVRPADPLQKGGRDPANS